MAEVKTAPPTEEFARNPIIAAKVRCKPCGKQFEIEQMLQEQPMPYPHVTIVEGFLLCPNCGHRVHNYYLPESLRHDQTMLKNAVLRWQKEKSPQAWQEYVKRQRIFTHNYDRAQAKCKEMFAKEPESERDNTT